MFFLIIRLGYRNQVLFEKAIINPLKSNIMKTLKNTFAILLIALFAISCNNNDDNPSETSIPPVVANDNYIRCKIDGVAYAVSGAAITGAQNSNAFDFRSDISGGGIGMDFSLSGQAAVGTYTFNTTNVIAVGRLDYKSPDIYSSGICTGSKGTLTINAKNGKTIEGTFSFTGKKLFGCSNPAKVISEGTFKVTFI